MLSPFELLAGVITRRPALVAGVILCAFFVALFGTTMTAMETGHGTYVDTDTGRGALLEKYMATFQSDSLIILVEGEDLFSPSVLSYLDGLSDEVRSENYVVGMTSIADLAKQANGGELPTSYAEIRLVEEQIPSETFDRFVPSETMTIAIVAMDAGMSQESQSQVIDNLNSRISHSDVPPGVHVTVTGGPAFNQQMMLEMGSSMGTLIMAAMVLMVVAVGLLFGHVRYRLLSVAIVATGLVMTFGFMGLTGMKISMVTIAAFPVLIGIGIDYAIQFHSRFDEEARKVPLPQAVMNTVTRAGPAVVCAMLATAIGFMAMWISPLPMIRSFGQVCVIGVVFCFLAALVIVPTFGMLTRYRPRVDPRASGSDRKKSAIDRYDEGIGSLVEKVAKHPLPVLALCALVALGGWQVDNTIRVNTDENTFVPPDMPAKVTLDKVSGVMGATSGMPIYVRGDNVLSLDAVTWMHDFQEYEETHNSKVTGTSSIADVILQYNGGRMPETDRELAEVIERIPEETKKSYLDGNMGAIIQIFTVSMESEAGMSFIEQLEKELDWMPPPPGITARLTGTSEMFTNLITEIREGKALMTLLGFGLIFGFLFLVYRRFGRAATPLVPIVLIVGWNSLIMYVLGIDYSPMTATLGSMTIGVASEYTILIMERFYEERGNGLDVVPAIRQSVQKIGTAITVSGLTTVFGFSALILSSFGIISNFGILTVITVAFALVGAIIIMPAILKLVGSFEGPRHRPEALPVD